MSERKEAAIQAAFERGQSDWRDGKNIQQNPYPAEADYHHYWQQGWESEDDIQKS